MLLAGLTWRWLAALAFAGTVGPAPGGERAEHWKHLYRARGEVRLLVFWAGRDRVGGGVISFRRIRGPTPDEWSEAIELVIGSNPERIPGKVNRWGYAREQSDWRVSSGEPLILRTAFEGVMSHSDATTPAAVVADHRRAAAHRVYEYKALRGEVTPTDARAEIRVFHHSGEIHYRAPEPLLASYRQHAALRPPQSRTYLSNSARHYSAPAGFLSGLRDLTARALLRCGGSSLRQVELPAGVIVHNATLYRLEVTQVECRAWADMPEAGMVAEIHLESVDLAKGRREEFTLAMPVRGPLAGIPIRILYQPHWWLKLRLDIELPQDHTR
jgi:hypothetical protein